MDTKVSEVTIIPLKPQKGLVALASCVIDDKLYIGSIGIYTRLSGGYRLTFPNKKVGERSMDICHPINRDVYDKIQQEVVKKYEELMTDSVDVVQEQEEQEESE